MVQIQTIGFVGNDATTQEHDGKKVINFSVASTEKFKPKNGVEQERTTWVNCSYWTSANIAPHIKKGTRLFVVGDLFVNLYDRPDGSKDVRIDCRVMRVEFISQKQDS